MSENCTHDCNSCGADCSSRKADFSAKSNPESHVKKVIGVVSGKGGVGKSMVASLMAVSDAPPRTFAPQFWTRT